MVEVSKSVVNRLGSNHTGPSRLGGALGRRALIAGLAAGLGLSALAAVAGTASLARAERSPAVSSETATTAATQPDSTLARRVHYRTVSVDGVSIFYREAGPKDAPSPEDIAARRIAPEDWQRFERSFAEILTAFGMDLDTPGTVRTPERALRALYDATAGYEGDPNLLTGEREPLKDSRDVGDQTGFLLRFAEQSPLDIVADGLARYAQDGTSVRVLNAYDLFLAKVNDPGVRDTLENLRPKEEENHPVLLDMKAIGKEFQQGIVDLFFTDHPDVARLTRQYGLF